MTNNSIAQQLIRAVEEADSSPKLLEAVQNLAAAGLEETVPTLVAALGYNNPGAAVAAVDGLIQIGEPAVQPLLQLIDNFNYGARAWAVRALAGIGDPRGLDTLLDAAKNDFALSVRRAAARGLGTVRWQELPPEEVQTSQQQALAVLMQVCQDSEWVVRYAAVTGLEALAVAVNSTQSALIPSVTEQLEQMANMDLEVAIRARAWMALHQLQVEVGNYPTLQSTLEDVEVPSRGSGRRI
ncbi:HEAT repeat domain-containing protein [Calothrix sp. UHCC 0171]|uniref:HEAT repeat domain-containing protein n=1 Tax=Calothrix sp. UHCC 0171 TaxID=3110245 RepID=UPI002B1FFA83|nr:HEAT repeat domain-containing protein [Calothrix sp. UHCC 0171]MEA5570448.1 HEAT repeat domain-containing protein [Calothrix sp. UHCC 0171]